MNEKEFHKSFKHDRPPDGLSPALKALWHSWKGDWDRAHRTAQDDGTPDGSWVHALLHREEGDIGNARYWYGRAGKPIPSTSIENERNEIIRALLDERLE